MRVYDTETAIYHGLRDLPWLRYLEAMLTLCETLRAQYQDRLSGTEVTLMSETLRIVRTTVQSGDPAGNADTGRELYAKWRALIEDETREVLPGHWNTWWTFQALAAEIAGTANLYSGAERLLLAATGRWREPYPGKARRTDPNEEAADSTPLAQTLAAVERIVNAAAQDPPRRE
jgi:hypothetical protein